MVDKKLIEIIESTPDWHKLGQRLNEKGYKTPFPYNEKAFVREVKRLWFNATEGKEFQEDWNERLPGSVVEKQGITYVIHGLIHDAPLLKLSDEYKQLVRESIKGWNVVCEHGFKQFFSLDDSVEEMQDLAYLAAEILPDKKEDYSAFLLKTLVKAILTAPFLIPYTIAKTKIRYVLSPHIRKAKKIKTLDDLRELRQYLFRTSLPEPLGINAYGYIHGGSFFRLPTSKYSISNPTLRSMAQAKSIIEYAQEKGLNELHALAGFDHEMEIKFFLKKPEYLKDLESDPRYHKGNEYINIVPDKRQNA